MSKQPKILFYDIESTPIKIWAWSHYDTNALKIIEDWYMLCFSHSWLGEKTTHVKGLCDYKGYKSRNDCEEKLVRELWKLFDEANVVCGHNIRRFDNKKAKVKFLEYGLKPYSPIKTIDTLTEARKFGFTSKKLDEIGKKLGVGQKVTHTGMKLWFDCMDGDLKAWKLMKKYNKQDVILNKNVYEKLNPWRENGVNLGMFVEDENPVCPKCGHDKLNKRGFTTTNAGKYQRFHCTSCGCYPRARNKIKKSGNPLTH